jgi:hypothetical protein
MLFEFPYENTGLEALHFHREVKQFKVGLPLALSILPKQSIFQTIKRVLRLVADMECVQNVPKNLLGQAS